MPTMTIQKEIGEGCECVVSDVGNGICYKDYSSNNTTTKLENIYWAACIAADAGLAPDVYGRDEHGYYTEIVECRTDETKYLYQTDEYYKLKTALQDLFGTGCFDLHSWNIGIKNGRLVCIDFGIGITE